MHLAAKNARNLSTRGILFFIYLFIYLFIYIFTYFLKQSFHLAISWRMVCARSIFVLNQSRFEFFFFFFFLMHFKFNMHNLCLLIYHPYCFVEAFGNTIKLSPKICVEINEKTYRSTIFSKRFIYRSYKRLPRQNAPV